MISDQNHQSRKSNAKYSSPLFTVEESFFLELLQKRENNTINIKLTTRGAHLENLEPFTNYYNDAEILRLLESLVSKKAITRHEKGAVLICPKCGGHANMPVLICPRCGSTKVGRKDDLNHSECQYWGPREEFIDGVLLRCPRCNKRLDENDTEDNSGYFSVSDPYFECQDCGTAVSKNNITMVCIKCSNKYTTVHASYLNSVSYKLGSSIHEKTHQRSPKTIKERTEEEIQSLPVETENTPKQEPTSINNDDEKKNQSIESLDITKLETSPYTDDDKHEEKQIKKEKIEPEEPQKDQLSVPTVEQKKAEPIETEIETDDEPDENQNETTAESTYEKVILVPIIEQKETLVDSTKKVPLESVEERARAAQKLVEESTKEINNPVETQINSPEPETIVEPTDTYEDEKSKPEILQSPFKMVSDLFKKKPRKKATRKQKPKPEPEPEPEYDAEAYDEDEHIVEEARPKRAPLEPEACQILMIVENVTVSEFIIEALEGVRKPINVIHIDEGSLALKELRHKYDALILDLDLKTINSKFLLSEMEKWSIMTPIIAVSDNVQRLDKYILNVETVLKKKQGDINKIRKILQKLL